MIANPLEENGSNKRCSKELLKLESKNPQNTAPILNITVQKCPKTFLTQSSVLGKIKTLMPKFEEAERVLKSKNSDDVNIENVDGCTGQIIEMDVALYEISSDEESQAEDNSADDISESDEQDLSNSDFADTSLKIFGQDKLKLTIGVQEKKKVFVETLDETSTPKD